MSNPNLSLLSDVELSATLDRLLCSEQGTASTLDELEATIQSLQVHRVELEMQNRALRESQAELEHSIQRYSDLYDHLPIGYVTVSQSGQFAEANLAAAECLQVARDRLIGDHFSRFLSSYDRGRFSAHLDVCVKSGESATIELTLVRPDHSTVAVQLSSRLAPRQGDEAPRVHIAITDVSALKQTQRILEDTNRELEAFTHSISHDLRAPLVTISNYARIIVDDFGPELDSEARGMTERIHGAAVRMEQMLKNLLEYTMLGREELALHTVNLEDVVRHVVTEFQAEIADRKAEVVIEPPLRRAIGSRLALNLVFANLLSNALKYPRSGESPRVRICGALTEDDTRVVVRVIDQGLGIDPKYHDRIFGLFERLHGYSRYPGSGVGLAIVQRAMDRMNGRVWVESSIDHGSCFCVELPRA